MLAEAGLVDVRREGKRRLYVVNPDGLETLERFLRNSLALWTEARLKSAGRVPAAMAAEPYRESIHIAAEPA